MGTATPNRENRRYTERREKALKRLLQRRLKAKAESAILRAKILNEPPRMKMKPIDAVDAYMISGMDMKQAVTKIAQLFKDKFGEDITEELLNEIQDRMKAPLTPIRAR